MAPLVLYKRRVQLHSITVSIRQHKTNMNFGSTILILTFLGSQVYGGVLDNFRLATPAPSETHSFILTLKEIVPQSQFGMKTARDGM